MIDRFYVPTRYLIMALAAIIIAALLTVAGPKSAPGPIAPLVTTQSASADAFSTYLTPKRCINAGTRTHCYQVGFRKQDDGTGISVEDVWIDTTNGCEDLNTPKYYGAQPSLWDHDTGHTKLPSGLYDGLLESGSWGDEPCNIHHDFAWRGANTGATDFKLGERANLSMGSDYDIIYRVRLYPNGDSFLERLGIEP